MKKTRGSITLEAVVAFTVFLSFMFMLLTLVKMSLIVITLDSVTTETAKQIATSAYPIGMFNDIVDDNNETVESYEKITGFTDKAIDTSVNGIFNFFTAVTEKGENKAATDTALGLIGLPLQYGMEKIGEIVLNAGTELIGEKGNDFVISSITQGLEDYNAGLNLEKLKLAVCKFPVPENTYKNGCYSEGYIEMGLNKSDYNADDVIIGVTYDYEILLPFLPKFNIKLKSLAIEHAWVNGGNPETISEHEGVGLIENIENALYGKKHFYVGVGGNSKCYHKANCPTLYRGKKAVTKSMASGYRPCKRCKPGDLE